VASGVTVVVTVSTVVSVASTVRVVVIWSVCVKAVRVGLTVNNSVSVAAIVVSV
jgi:hypothetical protein